MFDALLERSLKGLDALRKHIEWSDFIRSQLTQQQVKCGNLLTPCFDVSALYSIAPVANEWRIIDHCSSVTRLYAIYERFVHELLREFLVFLEGNVPYEKLDLSFRAEHQRSLGQLLTRLDQDRYRSLQFSTIISDLSGAFSEPSKYRLIPEAMLSHDQNLRMQELVDLLRRCGVSNAQDWLPRHPAIRKFFSEQARQSDRVDAELRDLVTYRNDAAHGGVEVDQLVGKEILVEYVDFIAALFVALAECVQSAAIQRLIQQEKLWLVGKITEVYSDNIAVAIVEKAAFSVNDYVYLRGEAYCRRAKIVSLQDNGSAIVTKTVLSPSELGLKFDVKPSKSGEIFLSIPDAPNASPSGLGAGAPLGGGDSCATQPAAVVA